MTVFMLSLIGLPPTVGLIGKIYLFRAVIDGGFYGLAIIGVLTSLISAYYYLRVVVIMYMRDGDPQTEREPFLDLTTIATAVATVVISLVPQFLFAWASSAVLKLFYFPGAGFENKKSQQNLLALFFPSPVTLHLVDKS